jgi:type I restriction enzyme R subunit
MTINTKERTFEQEIEWWLTQGSPKADRYKKGSTADYDRELAMDKGMVVAFIKDTQPEVWQMLCKRHGSETAAELGFFKRLNSELNSRGMIDVLRHGVVDLGIFMRLAYFKPGSGMNQSLSDLYAKNVLQITRQVKYRIANENSLDTVILLNGLPIITIELKTPLTGQTYRDAVKQYKNDRDPRELLLSFKKRAIVHFAVDSEQVWMTTCLNKQDTFFLPFNKGTEGGGSGNPIAKGGDYRTAYLWKEILQRDSILDILHRFVQVTKDEKGKDKLIFPRYHQLDAVRKIVADVYREGSGKNYLIQHSAGSGKSNSIAWLAHHLSNLHDANDEVVFHSIIVITDRRVLDQQLQRDIYNMDHKQGVVVCVDKNSKQLTTALNNGDKIIVCTLQKFPFVDVQKVSIMGKRFAIIVDEAHSSQTGDASKRMKEILSDISLQGDDAIEKKLHEYAVEEAKVEAEEKDIDEEIADEMATHGKQPNLSFFAFTATPKLKTLEIFGKKDTEGKPEPFHLYSMRQSIEEGFIFNVLENYTTYETYFQIGKKIVGDPVYRRNLANKALGKYMSLHPHNLAQKAEVIIEHFRSQVQHRIGGQAKAMLVTGSRLHAVRYFFEFQKYIKKMNYDLGILVAFSGTLKDKVSGELKEYTESNLNKFPDTETVERFDTAEYQILIVAEKHQTGFDQSLLHTMYVDKKLSGIKAVQTLSRVNRSCKGKTETFILDFVNARKDIEKAFQDYYQATGVAETTDPNTIYDIKNVLDSFSVYTDSEIDAFAKVFFKGIKQQGNIDLAKLNGFIDPAVDRYNALPKDQDKMYFKGELEKFISLYAFLTHIINLGDVRLHKFHAYAKWLFRKLPKDDTERIPDIASDVMLQYYRVQKVAEGSITVDNEDGLLKSKTSSTGLPPGDEKETLSAIIKSLNERLGTNFTEMDKVLEQLVQDMAGIEEVVLRSKNPLDLFKIIYDNAIMDVIFGRMAKNQEFCEKYLDDEEFRREVDKILLPLVHERLSKI